MALHELDDVRKKPATGGGWPWVLGRVEEVTHGGRVARLAVRLGRELGLCGAALRDLAGGALCHDLGKILLPSELLAAPRRLEVEERRRVETHPELGAALLRRLGAPRSWVDVALAHHERWDGGGYPYGLAGADIPLAARIVAVVDTYDAIVSDRPYRPARSHDQAVTELRRVAGSQLEIELVDAFCALFRRTDELPGAPRPSRLPPHGVVPPSATSALSH